MSETKKKTILIVDDDQALAFSLAALLKASGYATVFAGDGMYGIQSAHRAKVDLVILDLAIPAGGGFFVLENLRKTIDTTALPILILTAKQDKDIEDRARMLGASAYIRKPFEPAALLAKIRELIGQEPNS